MGVSADFTGDVPGTQCMVGVANQSAQENHVPSFTHGLENGLQTPRTCSCFLPVHRGKEGESMREREGQICSVALNHQGPSKQRTCSAEPGEYTVSPSCASNFSHMLLYIQTTDLQPTS